MTPAQFISKWGDSRLRERQGSQEHFIDLCHLLGQPTPAQDDLLGERYCFERGAEKVGGGDGWADVWRKGCFGCEYKGQAQGSETALCAIPAADYAGDPRAQAIAAAAAILKKRTLTNLYNERPAWLDMAHRRLDEAVAVAYGWPADLTDEQVLERLFTLNRERAAAGR